MKITIDEKIIDIEKGELLYDAASNAGIDIPTLCRHEGLPHEGSCRVCSVELIRRGYSKLVASCMYPIQEDGLTVYTNSKAAQEGRDFCIKLLLRRNAKAPVIQALAQKYGVKPIERLGPSSDEGLCIRCARCIRACAIDGNNVLGFENRGFAKKVTTPFEEPSLDCVGCLACSAVCPTGCITYAEKDGVRKIWDKEFELIKCARCSEPYATKEQLAFMGIDEEEKTCPKCTKILYSQKFRI